MRVSLAIDGHPVNSTIAVIGEAISSMCGERLVVRKCRTGDVADRIIRSQVVAELRAQPNCK